MLGRDNQDIELLVADLMKEKQRAEDLRRDLENEVEGARTLREQLEKELGGLSEHKAAIVREARESVASEANELQAQIREVRSELKKARSEQKVEEARRSLEAVRERLRGQDWRPDAGRSREAGAPASRTPAMGERVWLEDLQVWATVLSLPDGDGQIDVQIGQSRLRVNAGDIGKVERPAHAPPDAYPRVRRSLSGKSVPLELNLRGKRADEVEPALDDYLNDASLAGLSRVRIIHGYGTGTVRQIVRDTLATHPLIKSFRPGAQGEGGDGVTVVEL
jgi:DNA mismatch repair protein MutS2